MRETQNNFTKIRKNTTLSTLYIPINYRTDVLAKAIKQLKQEEKVIEIGKKEITVSLTKVEMIAYFSA